MAPEDAALADWEAQRPLWDELANRPLPDLAALRLWIKDWGELSDVVSEVSTRVVHAALCDTRDTEAVSARLRYVEKVEPKVATATDVLNRRLIAHPGAEGLPSDHAQWLTSVRAGIELYCEKNLPLHADVGRLEQRYGEIQAGMTVDWEGSPRTLMWMEARLQVDDRAVRERAWLAIAAARRKEAERLDALYDELLALRRQIAANLGQTDFVAYSFRKLLRSDYLPADCFRYHDAVEKAAVPLYRESLEARRRSLGLDRLRPWDLNCDPEGKPPLTPYREIGELVEKSGRLFDRLDPELGSFFTILRERGLLDLENRPGKGPGGYMAALMKTRLPLIYTNATGIHRDLFTLLHESGHCFHYLLARHHDLPFNRYDPPTEFAEVASTGMERLGAADLGEFFDPDELRRSERSRNEEAIRLFCWVATIDAFQHWIYTSVHDRQQRRAQWFALDDRFGPLLDWRGLEEFRGHAWQRQPHLYGAPFYYIEYGIAQIGALQVWQKSLADPAEALRLYKHALSLGGTLGLKDLFAAAGLRFGMDEETLRPLLEKVREEWLTTI